MIVFHMDVAGVAIATVTSQVISASWVMRCMVKDEEDIRLDILFSVGAKWLIFPGLSATVNPDNHFGRNEVCT